MKKKNWLSESMIAFKKIDKIVSRVYLFYAATLGFIFGWIVLGLIFFSISGTIPSLFVLLLRVFYFLISFLLGLKFTLFVMGLFRKKERDIK